MCSLSTFGLLALTPLGSVKTVGLSPTSLAVSATGGGEGGGEEGEECERVNC